MMGFKVLRSPKLGSDAPAPLAAAFAAPMPANRLDNVPVDDDGSVLNKRPFQIAKVKLRNYFTETRQFDLPDVDNAFGEVILDP